MSEDRSYGASCRGSIDPDRWDRCTGGCWGALAGGCSHRLHLGEVALDGTVLGYVSVISIVTGLLFGTAPALRSQRVDLQSGLKDGSRGTSGAGRHRTQRVLVARSCKASPSGKRTKWGVSCQAAKSSGASASTSSWVRHCQAP